LFDRVESDMVKLTMPILVIGIECSAGKKKNK
jgi:hypothetical protein